MIVSKVANLEHLIAALILGSFLLHSSRHELGRLRPPIVQCSELLLPSGVETILVYAVEHGCGHPSGEYRLPYMVKPSCPIEIEVLGK